MSIEGQGHFFTMYFLGFVCFVLYLAKISGERLQDHWSSGYLNVSSFLATTHHTFCMSRKILEPLNYKTNKIYVHRQDLYHLGHMRKDPKLS